MHIQLVTFTLAGISDADYRASVEAVAPHFAAVLGLRSKVWLADAGSGTYGGVYTWDDRTAMHSYLDGDLFATVRDNPAFAGVRSRDFGVLAEPTRLTIPSDVPRLAEAAARH
jgi:Putative mono-oxygenase ydhR